MLVCRNSRTSHLTPPHFRPSKQKRHVWPRDKFVNQSFAVIVTSSGAYSVTHTYRPFLPYFVVLTNQKAMLDFRNNLKLPIFRRD